MINLLKRRRQLRQPETECDRLSELPEPLLVDILHRLSVKEAAKTSVLSKQWRFLWTNLSDLTFENCSRDPDEIARFVACVRAAATSTKDSLERLFVDFRYDERFSPDVDAVFDATAESKVKCLLLNLEPIHDDYDASSSRYTLPQAIYSHSQLRHLLLNNCNVAPPAAAAVGWRSMTRIVIQSAGVTQRAIDAIASGCPALSSLALWRCSGFKRLDIGGRCFHCLTVRGCRNNGDGGEQLIEISAPYMRDFYVGMDPRSTNVRLTDASSLERARIDFFESGSTLSDEAMLRNGEELFGKIWRVKSLSLGRECLKVLSKMRERGWRFPQFMVEELKINYESIEEANVSVVLAILESCPFLDTLLVLFHESTGWDPNVRSDLDRDLSHLKNVEIDIYVDAEVCSEPLFTLAKIVLKRAPILEKMVIEVHTTSRSPASDELVKELETLLTYPRASQRAVVNISS